MNLHPDHLADLRRSGLTDATIEAAGIYTVTPDDIDKKLGGLANGVVSALAFPYPGCEGFERFKCWYEEDKTGPRYRQPKDSSNHLYLLPGVDLAGDSPLILTEGEKKALALWQAVSHVVGIGGVWNWCEKAEGYRQPKESQTIGDFNLVNWVRPVTIIFDSDGHDKLLVRLAAFRLARELSRRGAAVSILFIPPSPTGEKQGADDFLVAHDPAKLREMLP
jgi:hypothetical protein